MRHGWWCLFAGLLAYIVVGLVRESSRWLWRTLRR